jgi:hypothetical protein
MKVIDHNPGEAPDLVPPLQAAVVALTEHLEAHGDPEVVFVMVAVDVSAPGRMDNVRMVSNMHPDAAMELIGFLADGTLKQVAEATKYRLSSGPKH